MSEEIKFNLFPNTGHHYLFIPGATPSDLQWLHYSKDLWWLVCRGKKDDQDGCWVCVETNQGNANRARFWNNGEDTGEGDPPADSQPPYVSNSKTGHLPTGPSNNTGVFKIEWQQEGGDDPLDVDLVVDFGNTRTTVLALENKRELGREKLVDCCKSLLFLRRGEEYEGETVEEKNNEDLSKKIVDSWFILREPEFAAIEKDFLFSRYETSVEERKGGFLGLGKKKVTVWSEKKYMPQMFVEVSPMVLGPECEERLRQSDVKSGGFFTMSSPKRFLWDSDVSVGRNGKEEWGMLSRDSDAVVKPLAGTICRYTYENGRDWSIDKPPFEDEVDPPTENPRHPGFPRREAMVWAALCILENAYREITSYAWREQDRRGITRRLRTISLTYPSGWVAEERKAYKRAWDRAADIFALSHFENAKANRPKIELEVDEAVASQLPFVYSEITRFGGNVASWIRLFGKGKSARIMTIDIGGGTMDVSVVEYKDHYSDKPNANAISGSHLDYKLLFRDSNTNAGDNAVKCIIERLVLPGIFNHCDSLVGDEDNKEKFKNLWLTSPADKKAERSRITKLVFLPIVDKWLSCQSKGTEKFIRTDQDAYMSLKDLSGTEADEALQDLEELLKSTFGGDDRILDCDKPFDGYNKDVVKQCVVDALRPGIAPIADFVAALDVDIVTISGKITEIPEVRELVSQLLPIPEQRIVSMKDYMAGNWYPMAKGGRIADAKTVTVVGAALLRAIRNDLIGGGWKIRSLVDEKPCLNYWGVMIENRGVGGFQGGLPILTPEKNESTEFPIKIGSRIGRLASPSQEMRPEQVYELRWRDPARREENEKPLVWAKFRRQGQSEPTKDTEPSGEALELVSVRADEGEDPVFGDEVELKLRTLECETFWSDEGCFDICFEDEQ